MRERYFEEVNIELSRGLGNPRTVLDVGCGRGQNGAVAKARGAHVVGIESWPASARVARTRLDEVIEANVETDDARDRLGGRRFDLVLFGDVLEHTRDPKSVLTRFAGCLEDGGHAIISLPNVAAWTVRLGLLAGRFEYQKSGILDETHLRFFTRESALRLVEEAGLECLNVAVNPMIVRAGLGVARSALVRGGSGAGDKDRNDAELEDDPGAILNSPLYQAYLRFVRPVEAAIAEQAPGPLAFQNVIVARKPPARKKLSLTVGMISMNEAGAVADVISSIRQHAPEAKILLVDSSKDETPNIAERLGARVIRQFPPRGYGPAMHRLLYSADTDVVVTLDCDGTYPAEAITRLHQMIENGLDLVNAARTRERPEAMPFSNYVANRVFAAVARVVHGIPTSDVHSGMRAYRTSMLRALNVNPNGAALPVELLITPARLGYKLAEVEINYRERFGTSSLQKFDSTLWSFRRLLRSQRGGRVARDRYVVQ